jgi:hypothetical protein
MAHDIFSVAYSAGIGERFGPRTRTCRVYRKRDRRESEVIPGTRDGAFLVLYQFPCEALRETRNATVHGFICSALARTSTGYRLSWGIYVRRVSWLTRPYLIAIEPFPWILYPAMLRRIRRAWVSAYGSDPK